MTDDEIATLASLLAPGEARRVYWCDTDNKLVRVAGVSPHHDEPGPVAWVNSGLGHYLALWGCDPGDFFVCEPVF